MQQRRPSRKFVASVGNGTTNNMVPQVHMTATSQLSPAIPSRGLGLATNYEGHNPGLLDRVLQLIDYPEVTPDSATQMEGSGPVFKSER
jgi:hypothetical protein